MKDIFNIPNRITILRILLIPLFVVFLLLKIPYHNMIAAFIFIILSLSDAFDGYIARKRKLITGFGKILDPIADKLLIVTALVVLVPLVPLWIASVIIVREVSVTIARFMLLPRKVVEASILGKAKTISQIVAVVAVILNIPFSFSLLLIATVLTILSGLDYFIRMLRLSKERIFNIANMITTARLMLTPFLVYYILAKNTTFSLIFTCLIIASDKLDGISARHTAQITSFGRKYDAIVDFIVIIAALTSLHLAAFYSFQWFLLFFVPSFIILIIKMIHQFNEYELTSPFIGKLLVGISYIAIVAFLIQFSYRYWILAINALILYYYILFEFVRILRKGGN